MSDPIRAGMRLQIDVVFDPKIVKTEYVARCLEEHAKRMLPVMSGEVTHRVRAICPAEDEDPSDLEHPKESRAIGITSHGTMISIREVNDVRGLCLGALFVSREHLQWFRKNEKVLREAFSMNYKHAGSINIVGGVTADIEAFL